MKKIFALILALSVLFSLTACQKKTALTADEFTDTMEDAGYVVMDVTDSVDTNGVDVTVLYAENEDLEVFFYVFEKSRDVGQTMENIKDMCDDMNGIKSSSSVNLGNFSKFTCTVGEDLFVASSIDETMIFIETTKEQKDLVNDLLESLGYK
jgi:hypothetical protein